MNAMDSLSPERKTELLYFFVYEKTYLINERERLITLKTKWEKDLETDLPETKRANYIVAINKMDLEIRVIDLAIEYSKSLSAKTHRAVIEACGSRGEEYEEDWDAGTLSKTGKKELDEIGRLVDLHTDAQYDEGWAMMRERLG